MKQLSLRIPDDLSSKLKSAAAEQGRSVNALASSVLAAAVDPNLAGDEVERLRERLARAGILMPQPSRFRGRRPDPAQVRKARAEAGRGRPLSDYVKEDRT